MEITKKILLVQLCANGDCLYATTIARQIKNDYPGCHLTWAIAGFCKSIIVLNPYVDEILEVNDTPKNNLAAFRKLKRKILLQKKRGLWDEVFITQVIDDKTANYDGCIRSATFRGYKNKITVPVTPILRLSEKEIENVKAFAEKNSLSKYKEVVLFEFSPLSGQASLTRDQAIRISEKIVDKADAAVILSSGNAVNHLNKSIIDGSLLTIRETANLTNYCTFLLGSSSGITWASTSDAARMLPMVQLLSPNPVFLNSVVRDFKRQGLDESKIIEITNPEINNIVEAVLMAFSDFSKAKNKYHTEIPVSFVTSRYIICNLLIHLQFKAIAKHININRQMFGNDAAFFKECAKGVLLASSTIFKLLVKKMGVT